MSKDFILLSKLFFPFTLKEELPVLSAIQEMVCHIQSQFMKVSRFHMVLERI